MSKYSVNINIMKMTASVDKECSDKYARVLIRNKLVDMGYNDKEFTIYKTCGGSKNEYELSSAAVMLNRFFSERLFL